MSLFTIVSVIALSAILIALWPRSDAENNKSTLLRSIKIKRPETASERFINWIDTTFYDLLHFDKKDSAQKLIKEMIYSVVIGVVVGVIGTMIGLGVIGVVAGVAMLGLPLLIRWLNRRENKEKYRESFYRLINYMILYLSGGLNILKTLEETEKVIAEDDIIRENFLLVLKERKVSGISGDNIIESLEALNRDYNIEEIKQFINSLNLSNTKGISIVDTLKSQTSFIRKKQGLRIQEKIAATESKITLTKTLFGVGTAMALFILPPIISAVIAFSGAM